MSDNREAEGTIVVPIPLTRKMNAHILQRIEGLMTDGILNN